MPNQNVDLVSNIYTIQNVSINSQNIMSFITSFDFYYLKSIKKALSSVIESANNSKQKSESVTNDSNWEEKVLSDFQKTALYYHYAVLNC